MPASGRHGTHQVQRVGVVRAGDDPLVVLHATEKRTPGVILTYPTVLEAAAFLTIRVDRAVVVIVAEDHVPKVRVIVERVLTDPAVWGWLRN